MKQVIFVLRKNQIGYWMLQRGCPVHRSLNGNPWCDFTASYWDEWKDANQVAEGVDAILLCDTPEGFGALPDWLQPSEEDSAWNLETLEKLLSDSRAINADVDEEFVRAGMALVQGKGKKVLAVAASGKPTEYNLLSTLAFKLPKEPDKPVAASKPEPKKPVTTVCADSYGDKKALALNVGDTVSAVITVIAPMRGCYYAKSDALTDLIKIKMSALLNGETFKSGEEISFKVVASENSRVTYALA